jgi:hypothetical protein
VISTTKDLPEPCLVAELFVAISTPWHCIYEMVGLNKKHKRLHKVLACTLRCNHFMNRFVSLSTAEAILNELAPPGKTLPKAFLENGALNSMDANYIVAIALGHHGDIFSSIDTVPGDAAIRDVYKRRGIERWSERVTETFALPSLVEQQHHEYCDEHFIGLHQRESMPTPNRAVKRASEIICPGSAPDQPKRGRPNTPPTPAIEREIRGLSWSKL